MNVRIFRPSKNAMQSGLAKTRYWILEYEAETARRPESLMGWTSAGDTSNQVRLKFDTAEAAIAHAEQNGWNYSLSDAQERIVRPRNYADNFRYIPPKDSATK